MHDAIALLETIGQDARLRHADAVALPDAIAARGLAATAPMELATVLAGVARFGASHACVLFPVKEDEDDKPANPDRDDEQEIELARVGSTGG